jgi:hypothetical protein
VVRVSEQTQIGPSVDATLWKRFREDVKERHGRVRGVLGKELETALRQHLSDDATPTERRLEQRLIRIEDELGTSAADGGVSVSEADNTHTHVTDADTDTGRIEKPDPKAPRDDKVQYLAQCTLRHYYGDDTDRRDFGEEFTKLPEWIIPDIIKDEYGFRSDTAKSYVSDVRDRLDLVAHPHDETMLVTPDTKRDLLQDDLSVDKGDPVK